MARLGRRPATRFAGVRRPRTADDALEITAVCLRAEVAEDHAEFYRRSVFAGVACEDPLLSSPVGALGVDQAARENRRPPVRIRVVRVEFVKARRMFVFT